MAIMWIYRPLRAGDTFTGNQIRTTNRIVQAQFTERLCGIGEFFVTLPIQDPATAILAKRQIINLDNLKFGIITTLEQGDQGVIVRGQDLNRYLFQRITLYPSAPIADGLQGYDAISNVPTETVVKYFVRNNITAPTDPKRAIPGFIIAEDQGRGLADDRYMSRFENLTDLMIANLQPANMGYRVDANLEHSQFIFDVIQGVDRTAAQNINPRVVFKGNHKNLAGYNYVSSHNDYRNAFYASLTGAKSAAETLTGLYFVDDAETEGAERHEQHLNVAINLSAADQYASLKPYALKTAEGYAETENTTLDIIDATREAGRFDLGDWVSAEVSGGLFGAGRSIDAQVIVRHTIWKDDIRQILIEVGNERKSRFDILEQQIGNT